MKRNPLNLDACEALDKIQKRFETVKTLIGGAVKNKHSQQLKHYLIQLNVLLRRSEDLRLKFIYGASLKAMDSLRLRMSKVMSITQDLENFVMIVNPALCIFWLAIQNFSWI